MARRLSLFLVLLLSSGLQAHAQTFQTLPEVDAYFKVDSRIRLQFQAKETREAGSPTQAQIGPSLQFYLKPWLKLKNAKVFDLDEAKRRALVFSAGYRYLPSPDNPPINRLRFDLTPRYPMKAKILISDRNRTDLDWQSGGFTWRYRNRLMIEREFSIHWFHPSPYVAAEPFYLSQYQKWSTTALYAGCSFPIRKHFELNLYYEHQNNTGKKPNQQLNQFGMILDLYF